MSEHYSGDYTIEYPNEPYFVKLSEGNESASAEGVDENAAKLYKYLYELSGKEQPEALGLYGMLQDTGFNSLEFYNAMLELMKAGYVDPDFVSAVPARVLVLKNK